MGATKQDPQVQVLDGFVPGSSLSEAQANEFGRMAKYELIRTDRDSELPPYTRLEEGTDIVAVFDKRSGWTGVIHRRLVASVQLDEQRTARQYEIVGIKPCDRDAALATVWAPRQAAAAELLGDLMPASEEPF